VVNHSVPLARRNLLAEPRRLAAAAAGVGMALMLILLLDGLWAGIRANVTTYEDNVGAELFVAQPGTRNFFGAVSAIPTDTVEVVRADPDVEWAAAVRGFFSIVELHGRKVPTYVIGSTPGQPGGPWDIRTGRAPVADDEIAIGRVIARRHGLELGDSLEIMGERFTIVGTSTDSFMASFVFMTHAATDALLSAPATTSFVLVGTDDPDAVRGRISETGLAVLDRDELARNDLDLMARAYEVPLAVMRGVAFAIGSLVIALTAYSAVVERRREYGIVKAIGAGRRRLVTLAVQQSLMVSALGLVAGALLFTGGRAYITSVRPQFIILATPGSVARAVIAAVFMGLAASILPARRLAKLEPATAYRGG
jgi:putative ABC transport system permease protein